MSRNIDPVQSAVVSVCTLEAGDAFNVLPQTVTLRGTVRTLSQAVRAQVRARIETLVAEIAAGFGATGVTEFGGSYPVTENHPAETIFMADVAEAVVGGENVDRAVAPMMTAEDFSYMLGRRPGAYMFIGNGDSASLHHPHYDFNDAAAPYGASLWARLIETGLPLTA